MINKTASNRFSFDRETRIYRLGNEIMPSVTEVIKSVGLIDTSWFTEEDAWNGSCIHFTCQLDDEGDLDESSVAPEIAGYLEAKRRFYREIGGFTPTHIEEPMFHEANGYVFGGTADRIGSFNNQDKFGMAVVDFKTGHVADWTGIQLAAYSMFRRNIFRRVAAQLNADGTYSLKEFPISERRRDIGIFLAALVVYSWKNK